MSRQTQHYVKIEVVIANPATDHDKLYVGSYTTFVQKRPPEVMAAAARDLVLSRLAFEAPELITATAVCPKTGTPMAFDPNVNETSGGAHRHMERVRLN